MRTTDIIYAIIDDVRLACTQRPAVRIAALVYDDQP